MLRFLFASRDDDRLEVSLSSLPTPLIEPWELKRSRCPDGLFFYEIEGKLGDIFASLRLFQTPVDN